MDELKKQNVQQELVALGVSPADVSKFEQALPDSYWQVHSPSMIAQDLAILSSLTQERPLRVKWVDDKGKFFLKLYQRDRALTLFKLVPLLDHFGVQTISEQSYPLELVDGVLYWVHRFNVHAVNVSELSTELVDVFNQAVEDAVFHRIEHDDLNRLILLSGMLPRNISILRTYAKYLQQIRFRFAFPYIQKIFLKYRNLTNLFVDYFHASHHPESYSDIQAQDALIQIHDELNFVTNLDEDTVLRAFLSLISATVRTNFYQTLPDGSFKPYLSFKFDCSKIPELPLPKPKFEIFVYGMHVEGIHLRNSSVSRGGIRWSDRHEDYRTEILSLMKAQKVKNAIIVPSGAKGGFVVKTKAAELASPEVVVKCYQDFIRGLLDLTDNLQSGHIIHPPQVHCHDADDPYLVVAADKGTARFSDVANELSEAYQFWLGDAFASGGSKGYDHKKIGITARGAWESISRHMREKSIDFQKNKITVIGIGDMSGDVFGNGMLYSDRIRLIAAFDHRHIFIDPNPNESTSHKERLRLSQLPNSSWDDFKPEYLSSGGGIYNRKAKSIVISEEAMEALKVNRSEFTPDELIRAVLRAPVDLIFNGGIGTYVKASTESNSDVGDRTNDLVRVNAKDLRAKIVGEGGNLGFTQLSRIEYALHGGLINTDFIDNSGGVDCSDHEVNLKILLNAEVQAGRLSMKERDELLLDLTNDVAMLVLEDNRKQALTLSFSAYRAEIYLPLHQEFITYLEQHTDLDRVLEFLPDDKKIQERRLNGIGLTRPELAIILAYTKIHLKNELLNTSIPEDRYFTRFLFAGFPERIGREYEEALRQHPLRREIIATHCANEVINDIGITFFYRQNEETGMPIEAIMRAYVISYHVFSIEEMTDALSRIADRLTLPAYYDILHFIRRLMNLSTRWFLKNRRYEETLDEIISRFKAKVILLEPVIPTLMSGAIQKYLSDLTQQFVAQGLPPEIAKKIAVYRAIYTSLNIIELAYLHGFDLIKTAEAYFMVGEKMNLVWLRDQLGSDNREGHWNALARLHLRDKMDIVQYKMALRVLKQPDAEREVSRAIAQWMDSHEMMLSRWGKILNLLQTTPMWEYHMMFIALRELSLMIEHGEKKL